MKAGKRTSPSADKHVLKKKTVIKNFQSKSKATKDSITKNKGLNKITSFMPDPRRKRAEEKLRQLTAIPIHDLSASDSLNLIHELQVHQIELEMQNEELRAAQVELEKSRSIYSDLYDYAPVGYFTLDNAGRITEVNLTGAAQLGIERRSLIKKPITVFIHNDDQDIFYLHCQDVFKNKTRRACELRLKRKDKTEFYAQLVSTAFRESDDNDSLMRLAVMNIARRRQVEEELRTKQYLNELLIDSIPHSAMLIRKDRKVIAANRIAREVGAIIGGYCWQEYGKCQFIPEEDRKYMDTYGKVPESSTQCYFCNADEAIESRGPVNIEVNAWDRLWDTYWVPLDEETYLHYAIDITERKKAEEELAKHRHHLEELVEERTRELKETYKELHNEVTEKLNYRAEAFRSAELASIGELAAGVAHEINNPINGIINFAHIIAGKNDPESKDHELARLIKKEGDRIAGIISSLLSFARESKAEKRSVSIYQVLADSLALTKAQLRKDGIKLEIHVPADLPFVYAQFQQLEQVFLNIISNARHALNERYPGFNKNKALSIKGEKTAVEGKDFVRMTFLDTGTGIPYDNLHKIMSPFFTTKSHNQGTGLGLSISHGIITDHGGTIKLDSILGQFTKVMINLPVYKNH